MSMTPLKRGTVMDTSKIYFLNEYYILENLTVRLVEMDVKAGYKLMLASSIKQTSDTLYEIQIRETSFSNGEPVTLEDVKESLLRAKRSQNSHVAFNEIVKGIEIKNSILQITLNHKVNDFMYFLTLADLSVLHKTQRSVQELKVEDWEKVTSGPFTYLIENDDVFLKKNPFYKLSSSDYPEKIKLITARGRDTFLDFQKGIVDIGEFNLNSYDKHLGQLIESENLHVIGNNGDMINFFSLNIKSDKFKKAYNRQWLQKKILLGFSLDDRYASIGRKAYQFFTPQVKGFVEEQKIINEVNSWKHIDLDTIPEEFKQGITVHTYQRAFEVSVQGAFKNLDKILGFPVTILPDVPSVEFETFVNKKEYDIFLSITSMDQVIVGESINLYYFSSFPLFLDVNKKISPLMKKYQKAKTSETIEVLNEISMQMIKDSECVPLFYVASPFFYNKDKLDVSGLDEMTYFNLWKIKEI